MFTFQNKQLRVAINDILTHIGFLLLVPWTFLLHRYIHLSDVYTCIHYQIHHLQVYTLRGTLRCISMCLFHAEQFSNRKRKIQLKQIPYSINCSFSRFLINYKIMLYFCMLSFPDFPG